MFNEIVILMKFTSRRYIGSTVGTTPAHIFRHFIAKLEERGIPYCILAGYAEYPEVISSDVDFMVEEAQLVRLPGLIQEIAHETGSSFVQCLQHETSACYFVLASQDSTTISFLMPDACSDYRRQGRLWIAARGMLARRRRHEKGFYIPAADDAFIYYLIKKIDKGSINESQGNHLAALFQEDPSGCEKRLQDYWSPSNLDLLKSAAMANIWGGVLGKLRQLALELHANSSLESLPHLARQWFAEIGRRIGRVCKPSGLFVVFIGPDGSGKSTVLSQVEIDLAPVFRKTRRYHLRPLLGKKTGTATTIVTAPHAKPPRSLVTSLVKIAYFWADYTLGYWLDTRPRLVRSTFVLFDRYYHDLLVDPKRYRYGGPVWVARLVGRLLPKPDLWILLDAPPEVLQERKQEVPYAETARQREAYLELISRMPNGHIIDASGLLHDVVRDVNGVILKHLAARTEVRLGQRT
jgi:thymidylate kinase